MTTRTNTEKPQKTPGMKRFFARPAALIVWTLILGLLPNLILADTPPLTPDDTHPGHTAATPLATLDEAALKAGIAHRLRTARGDQDDRFKQFSPAHVGIEKKRPVHISDTLTVFAVKLRLMPPVSDASPEFITLVVDDTGTLQIGGIQHLATGRDLAKDAVDQVQAVDISDLPPDFGKPIYTGTGPHSVIVISDPFCPHCRKGWEFIKLNLDQIHTLRLAHFPLNQAAETAGLVMADAYHRKSMVFDIIDFTYTVLDPSQDPLEILAQYMDEFPELTQKWGTTPEHALTYLTDRFLTQIKADRQTIQTLGIHSTPVFFVNQTFIKGFNAQKMEAAMP
jgi:protein-disulfide isomerase